MLSKVWQDIEDYKKVVSLALCDPKNDEYCRNVFASLTLLKYISKHELAHEYGVSRPTVDRWCGGINFPHPAMRPAVYQWILEKFNQLG